MHAYSDHQKAKTIFKLKEEDFFTLEKGLSRMVEWAKKTGIKKSQRFRNIEILEKLPAIWLED